MEKYEVFNDEINSIKNDKYKESLKKLLDLVPDYFYEIPASSTGKYHPDYALGPQGLIRHTKAAFAIGKELLSLEAMNNYYNEKEKDLLLIAILLHDTFKNGKEHEKYTRFDHPIIVADFIEENKNQLNFTEDDIKYLKKVISSHMGQWNTNNYTNVILPKPNDKDELFVHICDYLASRKFIEINFTNNQISNN